MRPLFIGLISGTSMDGVDAALVDCSGPDPALIATLAAPYSDALSQRLLAAVHSQGECVLKESAALDAEVAQSFAQAALAVLDKAGEHASRVEAIGSHGQTLWHAPQSAAPASAAPASATPQSDGPKSDPPGSDIPASAAPTSAAPHTVQIGSPARIAALSGMVTVGDFRSADMALGGQGAPLAPMFHQWLFGRDGEERAVVNIGGIANLSVLAADGAVTGYDTGPGNTLLDGWTREHLGKPFDEDGEWARLGSVRTGLLKRLLADEYFHAQPPKSTGPERFNLRWLERADSAGAPAVDVQATLVELTAVSIADAVEASCPGAALAVCGGGASNGFLMDRLAAHCPESRPVSTQAWGVHPDWVEAAGFALLARARLRGEPGNAPSVTGARSAIPLGGVFLPVQE